MKYDVTFSCGHTQVVELFGKGTERQKRIEYFEKHGLCTHCYNERRNAENANGCVEVEMFYGDYKRNFEENCTTKKGSYDAGKKTIVVYVPAQYVPANMVKAGEKASAELLDAILTAWAIGVEEAVTEVLEESKELAEDTAKTAIEKAKTEEEAQKATEGKNKMIANLDAKIEAIRSHEYENSDVVLLFDKLKNKFGADREKNFVALWNFYRTFTGFTSEIAVTEGQKYLLGRE